MKFTSNLTAIIPQFAFRKLNYYKEELRLQPSFLFQPQGLLYKFKY